MKQLDLTGKQFYLNETCGMFQGAENQSVRFQMRHCLAVLHQFHKWLSNHYRLVTTLAARNSL
jgi:hypothetical protein